jgi:hypothetical protein
MSEDKTKLIALTTKVNELLKKNQQFESKLKSNGGGKGAGAGNEKDTLVQKQSKLTPEQ